MEQVSRLELVLGTKGRSGQQWDIWEAVYSPVGADGYPKRIWDKRTGVIDPEVAAFWRENYDLGHILRRDWSKGLGKKLEGKIHIYVGDMDNYYLNNAVYLVEDFLKDAKDPLRRPGGLWRPGRALLERRPFSPERALPAALPPDVRAADRGSSARDGASRRRRHELALLRRRF